MQSSILWCSISVPWCIGEHASLSSSNGGFNPLWDYYHRYEVDARPVEPGIPQVRWFRPDGWNGRRGRLKSDCPRGRKGSNPFLGTVIEDDSYTRQSRVLIRWWG